jgi:hypothetical protein
VQASEFSSNAKREEIEKADQAFFNQVGNIPDEFNEVDADVHRIVENPLTESTGSNVRPESPPEDVNRGATKNTEP